MDGRFAWSGEGDTLVVEVTNFNGKAWFDWLTFHSDALRVVVRFTIVDAETIEYEATIVGSERLHEILEGKVPVQESRTRVPTI